MKKIIPIIVVGIIAVGGAYFAGARYGIPGSNQRAFVANGAGRGMGGIRAGGMGGARMAGGGFTAGEVIASDDKSITVKLPDGGSKIIFLTNATPVLKSAAGARTDIAVGTNVMVGGKANQDGSISAESIQIRPLPPENKPAQ